MELLYTVFNTHAWNDFDNEFPTFYICIILFWKCFLHTVSPHCIIEFVRLWLQQGGNRHKYMRIIFSAATNPDFATSLVERYFPLAHYYFKSGTPGNIKQMHDVTSQDVKEKINDSEKV